MEEKNKRWALRFKNYSNALKTLEEVIVRYNELNELEKDGLVQRFEFTVELAWKVMQDYLKEMGYQGLNGPKPVITQMGADGLLDPFTWNEMLEVRNELSHTYDEERSRQHLDEIVYNFIPVLQHFRNTMNALL